MIGREDVLDVAKAFPTTYESIRKQAVRMAARRQFILAAKLIAAQRGHTWSTGLSNPGTFDRLLQQATTVSVSEFKLAATQTATNRLDRGATSPNLDTRGGPVPDSPQPESVPESGLRNEVDQAAQMLKAVPAASAKSPGVGGGGGIGVVGGAAASELREAVAAVDAKVGALEKQMGTLSTQMAAVLDHLEAQAKSAITSG